MAKFKINDVIEEPGYPTPRWVVADDKGLNYHLHYVRAIRPDLYTRVRYDHVFPQSLVERDFWLSNTLCTNAHGDPVLLPTSNTNVSTPMVSVSRKFQTNDLLKEKGDNIAHRYRVIEFHSNLAGPNCYVLERQETPTLMANIVTLTADFVHDNFELATITDGGDGWCNHEWATYDSGFRTVDYCKKCNMDKPIIQTIMIPVNLG